MCVLCSLFWAWVTLKNLQDPFHQRHPENTVVEASFFLFSVAGAFWFYYFKIILTPNSIVVKYLPSISKTYPLSDVASVNRGGKFNVSVRMKGGRNVGLGVMASGAPYFFEALDAAVKGVQP
jgi:hypothetical protein